MTYFELFGIPVQLMIDKAALSTQFFTLSRKYHPDYFANGTAEEQAEAVEKSALLNKAWKTFQNQDETIKYVLQLKNLLEEEEKYQLPPDFLMEVMEINEALMEPDSIDKPTLEKRISDLQEEIYLPVKSTIEAYKEGETGKEALLAVKAYYYKKKYLDRIHRQLAGMA